MNDKNYTDLLELMDGIINLLDSTNSHFTTSQYLRVKIEKLLEKVNQLKYEQEEKPQL